MTGKPKTKIRLVVADDAPFIREIVRHIFFSSNIEIVAEASDGREVVDIAARLVPDVILMDLIMPVKNGIEASREILSSDPDIKIVACSTVDQNSMIVSALEAGCCDYVTKPFSTKDLFGAIVNAAFYDPQLSARLAQN